MGLESRHGLFGSFVVGTLWRQPSRCQQEPESSSTGQDPFPSSCSGSWQDSFPRGLLDEGLSPLLTVDQRPPLPYFLPSVPLYQSKHVRRQRESASETEVSLCNLISDVTSHHLGHTLFFRNDSLGPADIQGEGATQGCDHQEAGINGSYLEGCLSHFLL